MTLLTELVLSLQPAEPQIWMHPSGLPTRAWFIEQMPEQLAAIATPPDARRPYTSSALLGVPEKGHNHSLSIEKTYSFRITTLVDELSQWLANTHQDWQAKTILLSEIPFIVTNTAFKQVSDNELVVNVGLGASLSRNIKLDFISPTVFRRGTLEIPFPMPELVFGSLLRQWNDLNTVKLHPDSATFAEECLAVGQHRLFSRHWHFEGSNYPRATGTVGTVQYIVTRGDLYWRSILHTLAAYAEFAGVGSRTAVGMGQLRCAHG